MSGRSLGRRDADEGPTNSPGDGDAHLCNSAALSTTVQLSVAMAGDGSDLTYPTANALALVGSYLSQSSSCGLQRSFSYGHGAIVGVYSGSAMDNGGTAAPILAAALAVANNSETGSPEAFFVQRCANGTANRAPPPETDTKTAGTAKNTFGVAVTNGGNLTWVKQAVDLWASGACLDASSAFAPLSLPADSGSATNSTTIPGITVWEHSHPPVTLSNLTDPGRNTSFGRNSSSVLTTTSRMATSTTASTITSTPTSKLATSVTSASAAEQRHGLLDATLDEAAADAASPCQAYVVQNNDICFKLGKKFNVSVEQIAAFNKGMTWGWSGCDYLQANTTICVSAGAPPMPNAVPGAVCGPLVPGTALPTNGTSLAALNPCPQNACCDKWGQCGITPTYCTNHTGPTGNPGTSPANENGCISNCGTDVVNNKRPPAQYMRVGYYESWNYDRPCLNMRASEIDTTRYTHVHWAFATIDDSLNIVINDTYKQWADFKALNARRIVSLGGWGYSTDADTYDRLRQAMSPTNHNYIRFAENIIRFLDDEGLDGIDIDWEYPGAPDIPGIPPGLVSDGHNYFVFLGALRGHLGLRTNKTISFAAPASYWYLQHFPVKSMAGEADYVVYMTYDLHGQWDAGNKWSQDGCPGGNCLRSHVNLTETKYALAMLTKAGVPTNKITVGVSSYGRSFGMADAGCVGSMCQYTGGYGASTAQPGACTETAGYIGNAEIADYVYGNQSGTQTWYDAASDSSFTVFANDNGTGSTWVAYMTDRIKDSRIAKYQGENFAGTVDWALDLAKYGDYEGDSDGPDDQDCVDTADYSTFEICSTDAADIAVCDSGLGTADGGKRTLDDLSADEISAWPDACAGQYMLEALANLLDEVQRNYTDMLHNDYDHKFGVYAKAVAGSADLQVHDFMKQHGNDYFSCVVTELQMCCTECQRNSRGGSYCDYCFKEDGSNPCYVEASYSHRRRDGLDHPVPGSNRVLNVRDTNETEPCPPDYSRRGYGPDDPYEQTVYWTLRSDRADAFYADLLSATGIPKDKVGFGLHTDIDSCSGSGHKTGDGADCWNTGYEFGAPFPNGYGVADVANPKNIVQSGLNKSANLPGQIADALLVLRTNSYLGGSDLDLVDAVSLPVLLTAQGVESMSVVVQTADKIEEAEEKAIILAFLSAILFFIPIAGEVAGAFAEIGSIVAILDTIGVIGNAALDIYTVVSDPQNAPLAIVSLILAPLGLADVATVARAARIQRTMKPEDLAKLGERVGARMNKIKTVTGKCKA
ncbi:hypothetical protein SCUCBS95973_000493 [Sporothrix curviconia]|uniref:chitinase n=1 Tax=Sporothrix curviconia TaxID=1260050 RepID=A0ABP0AQT0_9PEZI